VNRRLEESTPETDLDQYGIWVEVRSLVKRTVEQPVLLPVPHGPISNGNHGIYMPVSIEVTAWHATRSVDAGVHVLHFHRDDLFRGDHEVVRAERTHDQVHPNRPAQSARKAMREE